MSYHQDLGIVTPAPIHSVRRLLYLELERVVSHARVHSSSQRIRQDNGPVPFNTCQDVLQNAVQDIVKKQAQLIYFISFEFPQF